MEYRVYYMRLPCFSQFIFGDKKSEINCRDKSYLCKKCLGNLPRKRFYAMSSRAMGPKRRGATAYPRPWIGSH